MLWVVLIVCDRFEVDAVEVVGIVRQEAGDVHDSEVLGMKDRFVDIEAADDLGAPVGVFLLALRNILFGAAELL